MNIEKELHKLSSTLEPSRMQEEKVLKRVLDSQQSNFLKIFNMSKLFNLKTLGASFMFLLVVLGLPTTLYIMGDSNRVAKFKTQVTNQELSADDLAEGQQENFVKDYDKIVSDGFSDTDNEGLKVNYNIQTEKSREDTSTADDSRVKENIAHINIGADNTRDTYDKVRNLVNDYGGYVVSSNFSSLVDQTSVIELRIPVDKFEEVLSTIRGMEIELISENIQTLDRQNELTELESNLSEKIKKINELKELIVNTSDTVEKSKLEVELKTLENQKQVITNSVEKIELDTNFSTVEVKINKSLANINGSDLEETLEYVITFWGTILIWIIVPLLLTLPIWLPLIIVLRRKINKKNTV